MSADHNLRVLVTGAPGWLGTRLVEALMGAEGPWPKVGGAKVFCLVQKGIDSSPVKALGAEVIAGDLAKEGGLDDLPKSIDVVFHLAGLIHPRRIRELYALNTEGTRRLIEASIKIGAKRFIYVSSNSPGGVNRDPSRLLDEASLSPYKHYGISKRLAEEAVLEASEAKRIEGVIIRPCWFYGPNQPARQTRFFKMIQSGRPIIFGTGKYLRSMSYVDNTVQGLIRALASPKAVGQIYWIADERPYAVNDIYAAVAKLLGVQNFRPRHTPEFVSRACSLVDDILQATSFYISEFHVAGEMIEHIACSIDKAKRDLGYRPTVALEEGMRRSIEWCRAHGQLPKLNDVQKGIETSR